MGGVNAAIEVGKHQLDVALGSNGELFSEPNQTRAITRLAKRLAELDCTRVLIEGGSYQNVLVAGLRAAELPALLSMSAGTFVCNHVFYGLMHLAATQRHNFRGGFLHVPALPQPGSGPAPSMVLADIVRGIEIVLETSAKEEG